MRRRSSAAEVVGLGPAQVPSVRTDFARASVYFVSASYEARDLKSLKAKLKTVFNFIEEYMLGGYGCQ